MIDRLVKEGHLSSLTFNPYLRVHCVYKKNDQKAFLALGNRFKGVLELIYTDLCGPLNVRDKGGFEYFITFIDDCSRYDYVYLLHRKY